MHPPSKKENAKPKPKYSLRVLWLVVGLALTIIVFVNILPSVWFARHLSKNWNAPETEQTTRKANRLCLIFALDGVPFDVMHELHAEGYFKGFYPPGRLVSTFPSLTRPAFSRMLIGGKPSGYERLYFDNAENRIKGSNLIKKVFSTEEENPDYHPKLHFLGFPGYIAYVFPEKFTQTAIESFKKRVLEYKGDEFIAYMGISDAIAHVEGRQAQKEFLKAISTLLNTTRTELGILLDVVVFSDHGNNYADNQRVDLATALIKAGYRDAKALEMANDFVLLRNGFVSVAALYTYPQNAAAIATVLAGVEGVDFSVYQLGKSIVVRGAAGIAQIDRREDLYRYQILDGDPLALGETVQQLELDGKADVHGFVQASDWWEATQKHIYPDPLHRIWEGLHDLVQHPATLLISFKDEYAFGPRIFAQPIVAGRVGTHGALLDRHSYGFLMTDFMPVKPYSQPAAVAGLLSRAAEAKQKGRKIWPFR